MKNLRNSIGLILLAISISCTNDTKTTNLDSLANPSNIAAFTTVTQDNTGVVTFTPTGEGVTQFEIYFGDTTTAPASLKPGESVTHTYKEGVYQAKIVGSNLNGKKTEKLQAVTVSFKAPIIKEVVIKNDETVSKQVNVSVTADFAMNFDVYFGEPGKTSPVSAMIGETLKYIYSKPGVYTIRVVVKSAAIATSEKSQEFTVTEILRPTASAPAPPNRIAADVISIYGSKYTSLAGTNFFPDWGQGGQGSSWAEADVNGDKMLQYIKLSYQGIEFGSGVTIDVSKMKILHFDVWTADVQKIETSLISKSNGEKPVTKDLTAGQWTSLDIPITDYTSQGLKVADIFQLKFVGTPWAKGTVFIDNIYFYKDPTASIGLPLDFESTALTYLWSGFGDASFGPIPAAVVANPKQSAMNNSGKVVEITKSNGSQVWAGASLNLDAPIDFSKGTKVTVNVWSPKAGAIILFKIENSKSPKDGNGNPTVFDEIEVSTTVANAWQTLTFDLTKPTRGAFGTTIPFDRVILFPDFNVSGSGSTYYFDDIKQTN